jgi:hypothetical protein
MKHPQDYNPGIDNFKDGPIISIHQMAIGRAEQLVFLHERAAFRKTLQGGDLFLQPQYK